MKHNIKATINAILHSATGILALFTVIPFLLFGILYFVTNTTWTLVLTGVFACLILGAQLGKTAKGSDDTVVVSMAIADLLEQLNIDPEVSNAAMLQVLKNQGIDVGDRDDDDE